MSSVTREFENVSGVELDTSGDLTISEGEPSLTIHAPEGILDQLTSDVRDGVLVLARRPGFMPFGSAEIRYELTVHNLESIEVSGSGDVDVHVTDTIAGDISGSGTVRYRGGATVESDISGSGDVESDD